jgi:transcription initiation factor TFIID subunit TAF12
LKIDDKEEELAGDRVLSFDEDLRATSCVLDMELHDSSLARRKNATP